MWRAGPRPSATTAAQKPSGSVSPPLPGSQAICCAAGAQQGIRTSGASVHRVIRLAYDGEMKRSAFAAVMAIAWLLPAQTAVSVWDGVYTADQAKRGAEAYANSCASCHGEQLEG